MDKRFFQIIGRIEGQQYDTGNPIYGELREEFKYFWEEIEKRFKNTLNIKLHSTEISKLNPQPGGGHVKGDPVQSKSNLWAAFIPDSNIDASDSPQLFVLASKKGIRYGFCYGADWGPKKRIKRSEILTNILKTKCFSHKDTLGFLEKYKLEKEPFTKQTYNFFRDWPNKVEFPYQFNAIKFIPKDKLKPIKECIEKITEDLNELLPLFRLAEESFLEEFKGSNQPSMDHALKLAKMKMDERWFDEVMKKLKSVGKTDSARVVLCRLEQRYLRKYLFGREEIGICGICGKEFPTNLLVAAHIKKRSLCTKNERLDYKNIVMPMCKFGCDDLYERGFFCITPISKNKTYIGQVYPPGMLYERKITKAVDNYLKKIIYRKIRVLDKWTNLENVKKYFRVHRLKFIKDVVDKPKYKYESDDFSSLL